MPQSDKRPKRSRWKTYALRSVLAVLLLLVTAVLLLHIPGVQQYAADRACTWLSRKTGGEFSIERLRFNLFGEVRMQGLEAYDPDGELVLGLDQLSLNTKPLDLLQGHIVLDDLSITQLDGQLGIQEGLSIDYIIDAFSNAEKEPREKDPAPLLITSNSIVLENVDFELRMDQDLLTVSGKSLRLHNTSFSLIPNVISVDSIVIDSSLVYLGILQMPDTAAKVSTRDFRDIILPKFDFGSGFDISAGDISLSNSKFSLDDLSTVEQGVLEPTEFVIDNIDVNISNATLFEEQFHADIHHVSSKVGDIDVERLAVSVDANMKQARIDSFNVAWDGSQVSLNASADYEDWQTLLSQLDQATGSFDLTGNMKTQDLRFALPDSVYQLIASWPAAKVRAAGTYANQVLELQQARLTSGSSLVDLKTSISRPTDGIEAMTWERLRLNFESGDAFMSTIAQLIDTSTIPRQASITATSNGQLRNFQISSTIQSDWGDLTGEGTLGYEDETLAMDLDLVGQNIDLFKITKTEGLDTVEFSTQLTGTIGTSHSLAVDGEIQRIGFGKDQIENIALQGVFIGDSLNSHISILDSSYRTNIDCEIALRDTLDILFSASFDEFTFGKLRGVDSTYKYTGDLDGHVMVDTQVLIVQVEGSKWRFSNTEVDYYFDSLDVDAALTPDSTLVSIYSDHVEGNMEANFDFREIANLLDTVIGEKLALKAETPDPFQGRQFEYDITLGSEEPFKLLNLEVDEFDSIYLKGSYSDTQKELRTNFNSGIFKGFGLSIDSLDADFNISTSDATIAILVRNIIYDEIDFGDFEWDVSNRGGIVRSQFLLHTDTMDILGVSGTIARQEQGLNISPDTITAFDKLFFPTFTDPIHVTPDDVSFNEFILTDQELSVEIDGDKDQFELSISDLPVTNFNYFLKADTNYIQNGELNAEVAFNRSEQTVESELTVDSLVLLSSPPLTLTASASTDRSQAPFEFSLGNTNNDLNARGSFDWTSQTIDASVELDMQQLETFEILVSKLFKELKGRVQGSLDVDGPIENPTYTGELRLQDMTVVTAKPQTTFNIRDEVITLDNTGLRMQDFTITDELDNPLELSGALLTEDYKSFTYDLDIQTGKYLLIDNPKTDAHNIQGVLAIGGNIKLTGDRQNATLNAEVAIIDTTDLTLVMPEREVELMTSDGIVRFVDPNDPADTLEVISMSFYDSLVAALPDFNLRSNVTLSDRAVFRVVTDPRSGDYFQAAGNANLDMKLDRTGNPQLNGTYEISNGFYQLSFYDIVKKKFDLAQGSSVKWSGIPEEGELDITAVHIVRTSSIGLIGHEIGENEKQLYRKSLPYEVSINIQGTIEQPQVSFGLDLPEDDKLNYPALNSKLSRLAQPEFESELNKQVFGLLVIGGFIPTSTGSDFDEMAVATTAIANSVNSLLAAQLNRLTNQIDGVEINIGLQSYSDYQTGGSRTQTAMDFRVTKRVLDDRLAFEVGAEFDLQSDQSGANTGSDNFRGDITVIYDLTESGDRKLKAFNNETYDIVYHEVRNTGIALIFIREFDKGERQAKRNEKKQNK